MASSKMSFDDLLMHSVNSDEKMNKSNMRMMNDLLNKSSTKQIRVGGSKGKEGRADHTAGKKAFKRPCTVGWKSQNQPLRKGGGNKTPL